MAWWQVASEFIRNLELAFITLIIGFLVAKLVHKIILWIIDEFNLKFKLLPTLIEQVLYLAMLAVVLVELGFGLLLLGVLAFLLVCILFWFLLGIKDVLSNCLAGRYVAGSISPGRLVSVGGVSGTVERIGLFSVRIKNHDTHVVPHIYCKRAIMRSRAR